MTSAGAQRMWMYVGDRRVGSQVIAVEVVRVVDDSGRGFIEQIGDPKTVTVVDG